MKRFMSIQVQSKDDKEDFRSFLHCRDELGDCWELRGYGKTAGQAADDAWRRYQKPEEEWANHGYTIQEKQVLK